MKRVTLQDYKQRMLRVLVHIQQRLDEPLALEDLAARAHFSAYHFHRVFTGMLGESVQGHVRRLRLERAAQRLKLTAQPVTQIALDAGYETHEAFTRAFKASFGLSPSQFRKMKRPGPPTMIQRAPSGVHFHEGRPLTDFRTLQPGERAMNVRISTVPPMRVAFVRHIGPYHECPSAWDKLCALMGKEGLLGAETQFIGICHDDPEVTPPEKIRYDACVTVDEAFPPLADLGVQTIAGGDYAVTTHQGPYHQVGKTYAQLLGQWLPRNGRELAAAPCFEVYLNDPETTPAADLLTDVHLPLNTRPTLR